ncbi:hypothetical protein C1N80_06280 [Brachybacterium sp. SGAir0954]|uniref:hypothetical protein n=1 Tax=Brachybacterium sp. SGAir0954 TaxID=2571029 RepID=UPI0010CCC0E0|nr:hypothetical protein [Brachybacterium sp. SGAir0954]QCR53227.1 hypothetical protein C1N80_06280 [Brachybacterium sp. SGAir0954]
MTTLYRPVLIETTEQAEQLPLSTRAIRPDGQAAARLDGVSEGGQWTSKLRLYAHDEVIGWTALVPVEAEEERTRPVPLYATTAHVSPTSIAETPARRLVTPWEDA